MKLMVTSPDLDNSDFGLDFVEWICKSSANCPFKIHSIVESAEEADAIIFINRGGEYSKLLRNSSLLKKYFHKSFIYETDDSPIDFIRGIYVAMPKKLFNEKRHRAYSYLAPVNEFIEDYAQNFKHQPDLLFSFMGGATSPVRKTLFRKHLFVGYPNILIENTSFWSNWNVHEPSYHERKNRYAEVLARSKFILCPRGGATASYRLFETMQIGRVPIIIADDWVAPPGPCWKQFSIRIPENKIANIPEILTEYQSQYEEMGKNARRAWEEWFSPEVQFHRLAENILDLINTGSGANQWESYRWPFLVSYWQTRRKIRTQSRNIALAAMKLLNMNPYIAMPPEKINTSIRTDNNQDKT